jgi:hypothetical protein
MFATLPTSGLGTRNSELGTRKCGAPEALCSAPSVKEFISKNETVPFSFNEVKN